MSYADLLDGRRLLPEAYASQPTEAAQPALTGDVLAAAMTERSERAAAMTELRHDLDDDARECVPPELAVGGRHRAGDDGRHLVDADYNPWTAQEREAIRWTLRRSLLDNADTGLIPVIAGEVTQ